MPTPKTGRKELIGVVGYPYDLEDAEFMYEHFLWANWDLAAADRSMLEYSIDTYSGKPMIDSTVLFDLLENRSIRRRSTAASVRQMSKCIESTSVPASLK